MSGSQNLIEPLPYVTAPCQAAAHRLRPGRPTEREGRPDGLGAPHRAALLPPVIEQAMALMSAEFANIQLVDPRDGSLVPVAQNGFGPGFLVHFAVVRDQGSVCGQAARRGAQAVVADVRADPVLQPHGEVSRAAGVRAVQSTPLVDGSGEALAGLLDGNAAVGDPLGPGHDRHRKGTPR